VARRKKKRRRTAGGSGKKRAGPFNAPFRGLDLPDAVPEGPAPEAPAGSRAMPEPDDNRRFMEAMADVTPIPGVRKIAPGNPDPGIKPPHPAPDDELEGVARLCDLVSGTAEMDITFSDEYIEGAVRGFNRKMMDRLKKGRFPVQDYVDLHGLTKQAARDRVTGFLIQSHQRGLRCVLVVHGRGLNSENHIPVLKERLPLWLSRGSVRKIVLAFCTARPYDGGTGAVYILLRKGSRGRPLRYTR